MRVNIYAEEMTDRLEIVEKTTDHGTFTGLRLYLELPVTIPDRLNPTPGCTTTDMLEGKTPVERRTENVRGPFIHHPGDDDSAAVTFWGKRDLREVLKKAIRLLDDYYDKK